MQKATSALPVPTIKLLYQDMNQEMTAFAVASAVECYQSLAAGDKVHMKELAEIIKKQFDAKYPGAWHVVVGTSFGSYVTHEVASMLYFFVGAVGFLVFKHG